ncbi:hypothetical protein GCM10022247_35270 [Allokutzneria multivorans]|uniref:Glycosyl transferase family 28 C-terminal domain-containing protein n=1 Tax=Allokutzneria multivorans TaxID=1142134 RepID=A0ABP7SD02_9PSEU
MAEVLPWMLSHADVIHQCGPTALEALRGHAETLPPALRQRYLVTGYVGAELPDVLALADVVISRSGAGTIAEITALGKASVFIPLASSAGNEQAHNALHLQDTGAAIGLTGSPTPQDLQAAVAPLLGDPARRAAMAGHARAHGRPDAAVKLVDVVLSAVGEQRLRERSESMSRCGKPLACHKFAPRPCIRPAFHAEGR